MILRAAQTSDAPAICDNWNAVIRDTSVTFTTVEKNRAEIEALITDRGEACLVAVEDDAIAGFATYGPFRSGPGYANTVEHSVYLTASAQGQGAGRALMDALTKVAREHGKTVMVACISGDNAGARAFHAKQGFEDVGYMPAVGQKFGKPQDLCLMMKNL